MDLNVFAQEVHENAVAHGWYDGKPNDAEVIAMVHSEWSEALEAYRKGEEMFWYDGKKPEGIAVELMDGCIRMLGYMSAFGFKDSDMETLDDLLEKARRKCSDRDMDFLNFIAGLHWNTAHAYGEYCGIRGFGAERGIGEILAMRLCSIIGRCMIASRSRPRSYHAYQARIQQNQTLQARREGLLNGGGKLHVHH